MTFSIERILGYIVQYMMVDKWLHYDQSKGMEMIEKIEQRRRINHDFGGGRKKDGSKLARQGRQSLWQLVYVKFEGNIRQGEVAMVHLDGLQLKAEVIEITGNEAKDSSL